MPPLAAPAPMPSPAGPASGEPFLATSSGDAAWLSWLERQDSVHALRVSRLEGESWSEPRTIATSSSFFVNWADFPSVFERADGGLVAHWLARSGEGTYAYDVVLATSTDRGESWTGPVRPHSDGTQSEHGFVSLFPLASGTVGAVWLDGRETVDNPQTHAAAGADGHAGDATRAMTLRFTTIEPDGTTRDDALVDDRVCDCCQTDVAATADGAVLVYRDRTAEEVRDISVRRLVDGEWSAAMPVHADGWVIRGCPVNGPSVAAQGDAVAIAWFTAAGDTAKVNVAFSADGGATFAPPVRLDLGDPIGRVDALMLEDGTALVGWLERDADGARVLVRHVAPDRSMSEPTTVTASSAERASGFPRMARAGDRVIFAWTAPGDPARIGVAASPLPARRR
ncbi:MAG: glycoside hydrolase [Gemmatimonadetes bacterium]|nr:glycoside hydrolase [Gemmatimonadota bacterium]